MSFLPMPTHPRSCHTALRHRTLLPLVTCNLSIRWTCLTRLPLWDMECLLFLPWKDLGAAHIGSILCFTLIIQLLWPWRSLKISFICGRSWNTTIVSINRLDTYCFSKLVFQQVFRRHQIISRKSSRQNHLCSQKFYAPLRQDLHWSVQKLQVQRSLHRHRYYIILIQKKWPPSWTSHQKSSGTYLSSSFLHLEPLSSLHATEFMSTPQAWTSISLMLTAAPTKRSTASSSSTKTRDGAYFVRSGIRTVCSQMAVLKKKMNDSKAILFYAMALIHWVALAWSTAHLDAAVGTIADYIVSSILPTRTSWTYLRQYLPLERLMVHTSGRVRLRLFVSTVAKWRHGPSAIATVKLVEKASSGRTPDLYDIKATWGNSSSLGRMQTLGCGNGEVCLTSS